MPVATMTFLGAAQTVTGSKYLLEIGGRRIMEPPIGDPVPRIC